VNYLSCFLSLGTIPKEKLIREMEIIADTIMPQFKEERTPARV
jgi:hypothetical protein